MTGRLIKITNSSKHKINRRGDIYWDIEVAHSARLVPSILQVNQESRNACMKLYKKISFDSGPYDNKPWRGLVFYNKDADIIYFGSNSCARTIKNVCQLGIEMPFVAIDISEKKNEFCDSNCNALLRPKIPITFSEIHRVANILHGLETLPLNHLHNALAPTARNIGCKGLKEVFWVRAPLFGIHFESVNDNVRLQAADCEPVGNQQDILGLENRIDAGKVVLSKINNWLGDGKPKFHWVKLVLDQFYEKNSNIRFLRFVILKLKVYAQLDNMMREMRKYAEDTGSKVGVSFEDGKWEGEGDYGFKIVGTLDEIEAMKGEIERLCKLPGRVGGSIEMVDKAPENQGIMALLQLRLEM
jgi:hypothetical protein